MSFCNLMRCKDDDVNKKKRLKVSMKDVNISVRRLDRTRTGSFLFSLSCEWK